MTFIPLAAVERNGRVESVHHGAYVALNTDGTISAAVGEANLRVFGRSAWKPVQAAAMVACGLNVPPDLLSIVCSSHSGSPAHVRAVRSLLKISGVPHEALANTPELSFDAVEARRVLATGGGPESLTANCSGKHAGMLATCAQNGWALEDGAYLAPAHPLQREITVMARRLAGPTAAPAGPDGCGAPTFTSSLVALAHAFRRLAIAPDGSAENCVYRAMTSHPVLCAGTGRVATDLMLAVPGLLAKDGAEGVFAAAHQSGHALALKVSDGSPRPWRPILARILTRLGFAIDDFEHQGALAPRADGRALSCVRVL